MAVPTRQYILIVNDGERELLTKLMLGIRLAELVGWYDFVSLRVSPADSSNVVTIEVSTSTKLP